MPENDAERGPASGAPSTVPVSEVHIYRDGSTVGYWTWCGGCGEKIGDAIELPDGVQSSLESLDSMTGLLPDSLGPGDLRSLDIPLELHGIAVVGACCVGG